MKSKNNQDFDNTYQAPVGKLGVRYQKNTITELRWLLECSASRQVAQKNSDLIKDSLDCYFETAKFSNKLKLSPACTPFQLKVWNRLRQIPVGETISYGELAHELNTSSRAIGQACRTNPLVLLIPCHRVVSRTGLGGYLGAQKKLSIKSWLLEHESSH